MPTTLLEAPWKKLLKDNPAIDGAELSDALKKYANAGGKEPEARIELLEQLVDVAEKTKKQNAKSRVKEVTAYLDEVVKEAGQEIERIENEDDGAGPLDDEAAYKKYLKRVLEKVNQGPLNFAAALGQKPEDHKLLLHKSQDGKKLHKTLKDATESTKMAWGVATAHAVEKTSIILNLQSPQIGGLKKRVEALLKYHKPLPFDTVWLMVEGKFVEDLADADEQPPPKTGSDSAPPSPPDPEAMRFAQRIKTLKPRYEQVAGAGLSVSDAVKKLYAAAAQAFKSSDYATAHARLDELQPLIDQGLKELSAKALDAGDPGALFNKRLKELLPEIKSAAGRPQGEQAKLLASEAGVFARKQDFTSANRLLDEAEKLLRGSGSEQSPPTKTVSGEFLDQWKIAASKWAEAIGTVDGQLEKLRIALLGEDDLELKEIAEFGINAVTGNHKVPLQAAIMDVSNAGAKVSEQTIAKARELVVEFQDHIETDDQVEACDENPFEVTVAIRTTLAPALTEMDEVLKRAFA